MRAARLLLGAVIAGAAWLGLGVVLADDSPGPTLGAIAALIALTGGWAGRSKALPLAVRFGACLVLVTLARGLAGTAAAALAALCIAVGWWVRLRFSDAVIVLAAIGAAVVATSHPSWRLILAFGVLGAVTALSRPALAGIRRARARRALRNETGVNPSAGATPDHEPEAALSPAIADGGPLVSARNGR